jgi:hypothetical protein
VIAALVEKEVLIRCAANGCLVPGPETLARIRPELEKLFTDAGSGAAGEPEDERPEEEEEGRGTGAVGKTKQRKRATIRKPRADTADSP